MVYLGHNVQQHLRISLNTLNKKSKTLNSPNLTGTDTNNYTWVVGKTGETLTSPAAATSSAHSDSFVQDFEAVVLCCQFATDGRHSLQFTSTVRPIQLHRSQALDYPMAVGSVKGPTMQLLRMAPPSAISFALPAVSYAASATIPQEEPLRLFSPAGLAAVQKSFDSSSLASSSRSCTGPRPVDG